MPIRVSVVVPVFNPGNNIDALVQSLLSQSMPTADFEVVFVDDGSTDGTPERLAALATEHPHFRVEAIEPSGWPGRPRNVGTDISRGQYVFYADHDDALFADALARMVAMADEHQSDIVCGKVVSVGRATPFWPMSRRSVADADLVDDNVLLTRTVHKLFRRQFLVDHQIRFPEGPVRLEDHTFMARALPLAHKVSVLADYPCYLWVSRGDGTNNSVDEWRFPGYWDYFGDAVETLARETRDERVADAVRSWAGLRLLLYVRPGVYQQLDARGREELLEPLERAVRRYLPERLEPQLPVLKRRRLQALRRGDRAAFEAEQAFTFALDVTVSLDRAEWADSRLYLWASSSVCNEIAPPCSNEGVVRLPPAPGSSNELDGTLLEDDLGTLELTVRHRVSGVEWPIVGYQKDRGDDVALGASWAGSLDIERGAFGAPFDDGIWDVLARPQVLGETKVFRLPVVEGALVDATHAVGRRRARVYRTASGTLAVKITSTGVRSRVVDAGWEGDRLVIVVRDQADELVGGEVLVRVRDADAEVAAPLQGGRAAVVLPATAPGALLDVYTRSADGVTERAAHALTHQPPHSTYTVYATQHGSMSLRHKADPAPRRNQRRGGGWLVRLLGR